MYADNLSLFLSFLSLHLCLCLRNDASISTSQESGNRSILLCLCLCLRRTCKPGRSKRKHKALMLASHRFTRMFLVPMLMLASYV